MHGRSEIIFPIFQIKIVKEKGSRGEMREKILTDESSREAARSETSC